jgi:hypothetical protein
LAVLVKRKAMSNKPSPLQARILRFMDVFLVSLTAPRWIARDRGTLNFRINTHDINWKKFTDAKNAVSRRRLKIPTLKALLANGWVELEKETEFERYYRITKAGQDALADLSDNDFENKAPTKKPLSTHLIIDVIRAEYNSDNGWMVFTEISSAKATRRADVIAINAWRTRKQEIVVFEIKRSKSNFMAEIKDPLKRAEFMKICERFYFVAPMGILEKKDIPEDCGLYEVTEDGTMVQTKFAKKRKVDKPSWSFALRILQKVYNLEERGGEIDVDDLEGYLDETLYK